MTTTQDMGAGWKDLRCPSTAPEPIAWPDGRVAAACVSFDVDAEAPVLSGDPSARDRMTPMSHQAYGPLVGVPRILAMLKRHGIHSTFFVPGYTAHRYPDLVASIAEAGHEIAHHSYFHENTIGMDRKVEADMIDLGLQALAETGAARPAGYRAPMWELNWHTPALLAERGFLYDSSLMDSDYPYVLEASGPGGPATLVELPVSWGLDDWEQYAFLPGLTGSGLIESPSKALEMWTLELDAHVRIGGLFTLTCHPFLSGRPSRLDALERLIERMTSIPGLWTVPLRDIAAHVAGLGLTPRRISRPELHPDAYWTHTSEEHDR